MLENRRKVEQVEVLGEGRRTVGKFHKEGADGASDSVGKWVGKLLQASLTGGMAAGKDARDGGYGVVRLQTHRALR